MELMNLQKEYSQYLKDHRLHLLLETGEDYFELLSSVKLHSVHFKREVDGTMKKPFSFSTFEVTLSIKDIQATLITSIDYFNNESDEEIHSWSHGGYFYVEDSFNMIFSDYVEPIEVFNLSKKEATIVFNFFDEFDMVRKLNTLYLRHLKKACESFVERFYPGLHTEIYSPDGFFENSIRGTIWLRIINDNNEVLEFPLQEDLGFTLTLNK